MIMKNTKNDDDIMLADVALRKKVLVLLFVLVFLGALGIYYFQIHLQMLIKQGDVSLAMRNLKWISLSLFVPILPLCLFLLHVSRKTLVTRQYPPLGSKVFRDTKFIRGKDAVLRAKLLAVVAILLAIGSIATLNMLFRLLSSFSL